jgi:hypothetical protein
VRRREYEGHAPEWILDWVWIAPPYRRQGLLRKLWEMVSGRYPGILPEPPFSYEAAVFIQGIETLPENVREYALKTVAREVARA